VPRHPVQPPEWIDTAPIRVEESIEIAAPPERVWSFIADHEGWPRWFTELTRVEVTHGPTGVGGGRRVTIGKIVLEETFTAWDGTSRFALAVIGSNIPIFASMAESVRVEPTDAGCRVMYQQGLQPRRGARWLLALVGKRAPQELQRALGELRRLAEAA
jgi:carbon monoxide dehydrogenase subunit G